MMQDSRESTPLLRRTRILQGTTSGGPFTPFSQRDTSRYSDADDGKYDRRGFFAKTLATIHQTLQVSSLKLFPPMDDESKYEDTYNDEPWKCTCGTDEDDGIWMNRSDQAGFLMSFMVWILIAYSDVTILILVKNHHMPVFVACIYCTICALALASHAKTSLSDPGSVPSSAIPVHTKGVPFHAMCSICQTYKPKTSHHCRICNRCISRMDHHCPWMNNCVGAANMKHFILFLVYTWTGSALAILVFSVNYFFCRNDRCEFSGAEKHLVRVMTWLCIGSLLFTSSMLMNVVYGILTGIGTIDRLKKKATDTWKDSTEEAIPLKHIFGVGPFWTWCIPTDPTFEDYDFTMGYTTRHRLLRQREQQQDVASSVATMHENDSRGRIFDGSTIDV